MTYSTVHAIIFDLGRVIIHLDEEQTFKSFQKIGSINKMELQHEFDAQPYFNQFERGEILQDEFRNRVIKGLKNSDLSFEEVDGAWNAMLGKIDKYLIDLILSIKDQYRLFVLSNTNIIHENAFNQTLKQSTGFPDLHEIFHKVYFSHEIGSRKPELQSWQMILEEQKLDPEAVLFLDDREDNIEAAQTLGLHTIQITSPRHTFEVLQSNFVR